jgi:predicted extracellular nuclease
MKKYEIVLCCLVLITITACGSGGGGGQTPAVATPTAYTLISDIQGPGNSSPLDGQTVTLSAIVTGDFQDNDGNTQNKLGGFFVQQATPDSDPATSEGVFVYDSDNPATDVSVGDRVEVTGAVSEYFGETQINATSIAIIGSGLIQATKVKLSAERLTTNSDGESIADLERFEGMLIVLPQKMFVSNLYYLGRFGEVGLSQEARLFTFTNANLPNAKAYAAHRQSNAAKSLILDDGLRSSNPATIRYLTAGTAADYSIRTGDSITGLTGNVRYSKGSGGDGKEGWRLAPTKDPVFDDDNPRPGPPAVAGSVRIASINVLNFFSVVDTGAAICGPQRDQNCRGADSAEELSRQLDKTVSALMLLDADIVGLIEIENNATESIATIVDSLNKRIGSARYAYVDTGSILTDAIKTGFVFDASTIRATGSFALLTSAEDSRFDHRRHRPALAQSFEVISSGSVFTIVVNHLKSKGSNCNASGDPDLNDGQANCNQTRTNAATAIADWIASDPTASGDADYLLIGDLNAYLMEDPLTAMKSAGLLSLLDGNTKPYSYHFESHVGAMDHALASPSMAAQVAEVIEWHINADEPPILDYNLEFGRDPDLFDPLSPYRVSDHDPIVIGLNPVN